MPESIKEKEPEGLGNLSKLLEEYLAAVSQNDEAFKAVGKAQLGRPKYIASQSDLAAYEASKENLRAKSETLQATGDKARVGEHKLIDALPYRDVQFRVRASGKDYVVEKKENLSGRLVLICRQLDLGE